MWYRGEQDGQRVIGESLRTCDWAEAERRLREKESDIRGEILKPKSVSDACKEFRADLERRNLSWETQRKYWPLLDSLAERFGHMTIRQVTTDDLRAIVGEWNLAPLTQQKHLERLRSFFRYAVTNGYRSDNPAKAIRAPKVRQRPTLPYSTEEMIAILRVCDPIERAFVLTMRYSGLRIGDVATLEKARLNDGKLLLYTQKTGQPVYVPLPKAALYALATFPHRSERYFFWRGDSMRRSAAISWIDRLRDMFALSKVPHARPHRFRDTFAIEHLLAGVPIEIVSIWLGHSSVKITEKYYSPWVRARQLQAEALAVKTWERDVVLLSETKTEKPS